MVTLTLSQCMDGRGARGLTGVFDGLTLHGFKVVMYNSLAKHKKKNGTECGNATLWEVIPIPHHCSSEQLLHSQPA